MNIYASSSLHIKKYELEFTPVELKLFMKGVRVHVIPMNTSNSNISSFIECSSASNPCKLSFDDNAIKILSDVRQLVCPFVLQNGHKYWMRMR